jgi:tetratricopeptide (TPR) repeat protein
MGVDRAAEKERGCIWIAPNWILGELAVLCEIPDEDLAVELWRAVAKVRLWAQSRENRGALFGPRDESSAARTASIAGADPEVARLLNDLSRFHDKSDPPTDPEVILACRNVVAWAERRAAYETAMQFAEAAAMVAPADPSLANESGRVCRRAGNRPRAEVWYARGIGLARQSQNKSQYASAYLGLAAVLRDGGEHHAALRLIRRAGNAAKRAGLRGKSAEAYQDALGVATIHGHFTRAAFFARRALSVYPVHHGRFPAFAHDVAFLLVNQGLYQAALSTLPAVLRHIHRPIERLVVLGTLARAAGGAGNHESFRSALNQIRDLAFAQRSTWAGALYSAAEGARQLGLWAEAADLADEASTAARENEDPVVLQLTTQLALEIKEGIHGVETCREDDPAGRYLRTLAAELQLRLARWRGPTWRPRRAPRGE